MTHRLFFLSLWLIVFALLGGCVTVPQRGEPARRVPREPVSSQPTATEQRQVRPYSTPSAKLPTARPPAEVAPARETSPAVLALLSEADRQLAAGQLDNVATTLERAIRIKPKSAELWHKMARVRLQQNQPGQAENLAKRSNVLAKGERDITRRNWALIAEARRLKGDQAGAAEAEARAAR